jgi:phenylacetic acid degradation operon negative regulatory protein
MTGHDEIPALLDAVTARLQARGRLRVWSLVVTIFGDAVVPRGGRVALAVLQEIVGRLGIEAGALRTAMSRLASDGWVERERQGRNSFFSLGRQGRHAFDLATRRIYAGAPPAWGGDWTVAILPPGAGEIDVAEMQALGFVRIAPGVHLRPEADGAPDASAALSGMLVVHGASTDHPETLHALWPSEETAAAYRAFIAAFLPLRATLGDGARPLPLDAVAARTLLVHEWRRIVLRDPGLPVALLPRDWPGEAARELARDIYAALAGQSEDWLDTAGLPQPLDPAGFSRRWNG